MSGGLELEGITKSFPGSGPVLTGVDLVVPAGDSLAVLGPSGCGKTTLLRIIAGLERPDAGTVRLAGRVLSGPSTWVEPQQRRIGMVFQDWALFDHLNVARNVGFGLPRPERRSSARIDESLALVGLSAYGERAVATLSGGQQQRVALARALAPRPDVLLLDEPFSNLDAALRASVRSEVHRILGGLGVTAVFVTHDQQEAFLLGDRIALMNEGRVVQLGTPVEVYEQPVDRWVATFVGEANFVRATLGAGVAHSPLGTVPVTGAGVATGQVLDAPVDLLVRPERVVLGGAGADVEVAAEADVVTVEYLGHATRYLLTAAGTPLSALVLGGPRCAPGERVRVGLAAGSYRVFPVESDSPDGP